MNSSRLVRALCFVLAIAAVPALAQPSSTTAPPASRKVYSVKDSPGYVPLVDPESTAALIGRRTNAPLVQKPFRGGARSLEALGAAVCRYLERSRQDSLLGACVTHDEFRDIMWREFPHSRPATGIQCEDAWRILFGRLQGGTGQAVRDHGSRSWQLVRVEAVRSPVAYKNFRLHDAVVLVVRDDLGQIQRWNWIRSVAERKGVFKIYSLED